MLVELGIGIAISGVTFFRVLLYHRGRVFAVTFIAVFPSDVCHVRSKLMTDDTIALIKHIGLVKFRVGISIRTNIRPHTIF